MSDVEHGSSHPAEPGLEDWRRLLGKALKGRDISTLSSRTRDAIVVEPLYAAAREAAPAPGRGARPWGIVQIVDAPDPDAANAQALADLAGGANGLSLRFAGAPSAAGHGLPPTADALRIALEGVDLAAIHLRIEPHADAIATTQWLRDMVATSGVAPELTDIAFGLDPVAAAIAADAGSAPDPRQFGACFGALSRRFLPRVLRYARRAASFHEAGATEAQELAGILAAAAWWLRALDDSRHLRP